VSQGLDPTEEKKFQNTNNKTIRSSTVCNSPIWMGHLTREESIRNMVNRLQTKLWFEKRKEILPPFKPKSYKKLIFKTRMSGKPSYTRGSNGML